MTAPNHGGWTESEASIALRTNKRKWDNACMETLGYIVPEEDVDYFLQLTDVANTDPAHVAVAFDDYADLIATEEDALGR